MNPILQFLLAMLIGAFAAGVNAVAGGGTLFSFPLLVFGFHVPAINANATNSVGLWPGSMAGALGLRNLLDRAKHHLKRLWLPTLIGSQLGAFLLLRTDPKTFFGIVPVFILLAATLLAFQKKIRTWATGPHGKIKPWVGMVLQFIISVYGGYFGAGIGIMMLGAFSLYVDGNIHELNAIKNWLGLLVNFSVTITFMLNHLVRFDVALPLMLGALVGGFGSARISQRIDAEKLRIAITVYGFGAATFFFYQVITRHH